MRTSVRAAVGTVAVGGVMVLGAAAAHAELGDPVSINQVQTCDNYTNEHNSEAGQEKHSISGGNFKCTQSKDID